LTSSSRVFVLSGVLVFDGVVADGGLFFGQHVLVIDDVSSFTRDGMSVPFLIVDVCVDYQAVRTTRPPTDVNVPAQRTWQTNKGAMANGHRPEDA